MKALLAFGGSRGDAQPGVLLARELIRRHHHVTLAVSPNLLGHAVEYDVPAVSFGPDTGELLRAQFSRAGRRGPIGQIKALRALSRQGFAESVGDLLPAAAGIDVVVGGMANEEVARGVAASSGVPFAAVHYFPILPSRSVPIVPTKLGENLPGGMNHLGWTAVRRARAWAVSPDVTALRNRAPAIGNAREVAIQAYDERLFGRLGAEWRSDRPFTGFLAPPRVIESIDARLSEWLTAGSAPVYAGFGSMPVDDPLAAIGLLHKCCARLGRRLLFIAGWNTIDPVFTPELVVVPSVDHTAVLPHCAVAVHHGGAGTTAAALRAGVPSVVCSFMADQHYWGQRIQTLGLGAALPFSRLTSRRLNTLLETAQTDRIAQRTAAFAATFRHDGVQRCADIVEWLAHTGSSAIAVANERSS
ncbi:glycosyltransferase [Nocardia terpenica]|uniref:Erythromycin biosynthesis protein CIII-like C-terminal domain-containing protein n=1 Tax=Nocardia terpenica TaxID=455432 RepID=A0A291RPV2_9NOCA|nr:glycosyltransferase [Nocardia terpenica]ATL69244.1 hypothetical protein CRH09_26790 [Nocardia terpenica]